MPSGRLVSLALAAALVLGCAGQRSSDAVRWGPPPGAYYPPQSAYPLPPGAYPFPPGAYQGPSPWSGAPAAVAFAQSRLGAPYCWGGAGPQCYDCSGLTHAAWLAAGKAIPRTSAAQASALPAVPVEQAQPGDILWRPGHVGLYIGQGWAIAAPGTGKVIRYQAAAGFVRALRP